MGLEKFKEILMKQLSICLNEKQRSKLQNTYCFVSKSSGLCIDLLFIHKIEASQALQSVYDNINIGINYDEDAQDAAGYTGNMHRK